MDHIQEEWECKHKLVVIRPCKPSLIFDVQLEGRIERKFKWLVRQELEDEEKGWGGQPGNARTRKAKISWELTRVRQTLRNFGSQSPHAGESRVCCKPRMCSVRFLRIKNNEDIFTSLTIVLALSCNMWYSISQQRERAFKEKPSQH
jgi:hypothetical protein